MAGSQQMLMAGGASYPELGGSVSASSVTPTNSTATLQANADGTITGAVSTTGSTTGLPDIYVRPLALGAGMYVRLTVSSGLSPTGGSAVGSWVALSGDPSWSLTRSTVGVASATWLLEFALTSGGTPIVNSGSFNIDAEEV